MKITVFNGSPRGAKSNTKILLEHLLQGYRSETDADVEIEVHFLNRRKQRAAQREAFARADLVVLAFPLYVHAMPGIVKELLEVLEPRDPAEGVSMACFVQQGFPETHQSAWLTPYLERLPARLGCRSAGIAVKGGVEGIQIKPAWMTRKLYRAFHDLGGDLARRGRFDAGRLEELAQPVHLGAARRLLFRAMSLTGLTNFYWDKNLKDNGAYDQRHARPYEL